MFYTDVFLYYWWIPNMRGGGGSPVSWISTSHSVCWHGENLNLLAHWVLIFSLSLSIALSFSLSLSYFSFFYFLSLSLTSLSFSFSLSLLLLFLFLSLFYFSFSLFLSFREHSVASYSLSMETKRRGRFEKQFLPFLHIFSSFSLRKKP